MDALPAPTYRSDPLNTEGQNGSACGLSAEDAESWLQAQRLAQATLHPWVFAIAVGAMTLAVVLLLWLGKASAGAELDSAEVLVPLAPSSMQDDHQR